MDGNSWRVLQQTSLLFPKPDEGKEDLIAIHKGLMAACRKRLEDSLASIEASRSSIQEAQVRLNASVAIIHQSRNLMCGDTPVPFSDKADGNESRANIGIMLTKTATAL
jgi:hypothetical protein